MGGKVWTTEEERYFWTEIAPLAPAGLDDVSKKAKSHREIAKAWAPLAIKMRQEMERRLQPGDQLLRKYTHVGCYEHYFQNYVKKKASPNAEPWLKGYKNFLRRRIEEENQNRDSPLPAPSSSGTQDVNVNKRQIAKQQYHHRQRKLNTSNDRPHNNQEGQKRFVANEDHRGLQLLIEAARYLDPEAFNDSPGKEDEKTRPTAAKFKQDVFSDNFAQDDGEYIYESFEEEEYEDEYDGYDGYDEYDEYDEDEAPESYAGPFMPSYPPPPPLEFASPVTPVPVPALRIAPYMQNYPHRSPSAGGQTIYDPFTGHGRRYAGNSSGFQRGKEHKTRHRNKALPPYGATQQPYRPSRNVHVGRNLHPTANNSTAYLNNDSLAYQSGTADGGSYSSGYHHDSNVHQSFTDARVNPMGGYYGGGPVPAANPYASRSVGTSYQQPSDTRPGDGIPSNRYHNDN